MGDRMPEKIKNNRGGIAIIILWSAIFFILLLAGTFVIEIYYTNAKAEIAKDAVTMSALSVYKGIDPSQLSSGEIEVNNQMTNTFKEYLAKNMKLNSDLTARPNSIAVGQVNIDQFIVYKKSSTEQVYPDGSPINYKPSLFVKIKFDIEPMLKGILGNRKTVYSWATADLINQ